MKIKIQYYLYTIYKKIKSIFIKNKNKDRFIY